jgi:hypothetical protein
MRTIKFLLAIFSSLAVAACGGGGGYGSGNGGGNMCGYTAIYSISGTVSGSTHNVGVTIDLTGDAIKNTTTGTGGNYSFTCLANGSYSVTPTLGGYTFSPASAVVAVSGVNMTKNFTESP